MRDKTAVSYLPIFILFVIAPFAVGLYYEFLSAAASVILLICLWLYRKHAHGLVLPKEPVFTASLMITLFFLLSPLWAVDRGMAVLGFVKFLPLPLFALCLAQLDAGQRASMLRSIPVTGAAMTVLSFALSLIPAFGSTFLVNSRLAGFFQYPNVFALYLLIGVLITASDKKWDALHLAVLIVLSFGIFESGSRTTFLLFAASILYLCVFSKDRRSHRSLLISFGLIVAATAVYVICTGNVSSVGRYVTTSLSSSTFLGRLLYFKDALPVILRHPLGLGYMGYHYLQGSFQTGVYSVASIHNELLQLLLDIGWIPAGVALYAFVKSFIRADSDARLLLLVILAHCMMDFDLQFISVGFVLILIMMNTKVSPEKTERKKAVKCFVPLTVILSSVCLYFGIACGLYYAGDTVSAAAIYPGYTLAWENILLRAEDVSEMDAAANEILKRNSSHSLANSAKARVAYSEGDFVSMIKYKEKAIAAARYSLNEYLDYAAMLDVGVQLYTQNGDSKGAEYCRKHLRNIPEMIDDVLADTSSIAWKLDEKPQLTLPDEFYELKKQIW